MSLNTSFSLVDWTPFPLSLTFRTVTRGILQIDSRRSPVSKRVTLYIDKPRRLCELHEYRSRREISATNFAIVAPIISPPKETKVRSKIRIDFSFY